MQSNEFKNKIKRLKLEVESNKHKVSDLEQQTKNLLAQLEKVNQEKHLIETKLKNDAHLAEMHIKELTQNLAGVDSAVLVAHLVKGTFNCIVLYFF